MFKSRISFQKWSELAMNQAYEDIGTTNQSKELLKDMENIKKRKMDYNQSKLKFKLNRIMQGSIYFPKSYREGWLCRSIQINRKT